MFEFTLISNEAKIFNGNVSKVTFETDHGMVEILSQHQPYMARIQSSIVYVKEDGTQGDAQITDGFIYTNGMICYAVV
ncbi:MAG: hypothetical protein LBJ92_02150 [Holosporales bacterium]|jgi:F0F1-type ATP synthase epsilon subunit|nr:hypothetical protein [Holosporales bacterium]